LVEALEAAASSGEKYLGEKSSAKPDIFCTSSNAIG
jgi:hypothetical protein